MTTAKLRMNYDQNVISTMISLATKYSEVVIYNVLGWRYKNTWKIKGM